jgi:hypothetical protein
MGAQVATFAGCLIPSQIARLQATKISMNNTSLHKTLKTFDNVQVPKREQTKQSHGVTK